MRPIESIDDPRIAAYRNLRDRTLRGESLFIAEGEVVTERLLGSEYGVDSLLVAERFADKFQRLAGQRAAVFVAPESLLAQVVGFNFHRGVLAIGRRPEAFLALSELLARSDRSGPLALAICPEVTKPDNLGLIFRSAGAFGIDGVVLGPRCCDPLSRRTLRVSMGAALHVPWVRSADLLDDLRRLKAEAGAELVATVLEPQAERLAAFRWPPRVGLLLGNETAGLAAECLALCDHRVTIPMHPKVDSLNLGVAAGVFLYDLSAKRRREVTKDGASG